MYRIMQLVLFFCATGFISVAQENRIGVHDPVMIKQDSMYYLFCTGRGISVWSSPNMKDWKRENPVFANPPEWAVKAIPAYRGHTWAPDIYYHNGLYYLYYSVSAFGKNTSCIGVATNKTLHPASPDFKWVDHGKVIQSVPGRDMWNAIDPNLIFDENNTPWLSFGSFWNGLKLVKLGSDLKSVAEPQEWYTIASRRRREFSADSSAGDGAIEAPFVIRKGKYYYLFASVDYCCRGVNSTYKMIVGRSEKVTGPYLDQQGESLAKGGGTIVLQGDKDWFGVGHNSAYTFEGKDYLVFHGYDAKDNGRSKLIIKNMKWTNEGWPVVE
jgi:arabinan endo-1,5-alpha-L-arabinosidase